MPNDDYSSLILIFRSWGVQREHRVPTNLQSNYAHGEIHSSVVIKHTKPYGKTLLFQSPPFWCLMTTQEFAMAYDIMMRYLDLQKLDGAPP